MTEVGFVQTMRQCCESGIFKPTKPRPNDIMLTKQDFLKLVSIAERSEKVMECVGRFAFFNGKLDEPDWVRCILDLQDAYKAAKEKK